MSHFDLDKARLASKFSLSDDRRVATVITTHAEYAKKLGEQLANVVVVCNPEHPLNPDDLRRGTIIQFEVTRRNTEVAVDLLGALKELQSLGWIGNAERIVSSPKSSSLLKLQEVVDIVCRHLK
ncbi:MAG: hypothetical protein ACYC44_01780 [Patescibacteria group bacterium]